ncbi:hypothetical protein ABFS83_10G031800 [Erythranthe nasuta]
MDSYSEKNNGYETNGSSDSNDEPENIEESTDFIIWSNVFKCDVVNGVLAPEPISCVPLDQNSPDESSEYEEEPEPEPKPEPEPGLDESNGERKNRNAGNKELMFKLYKFANAFEQYLLEKHEVETGNIDRCHVQVYENNGSWKVGVHKLATGDHVVQPVLEDPTPPTFLKIYPLSLQDRLFGWTVEIRKRRSTGKDDKFYYHGSRQFRSFIEVATYIMYSSKVKNLQKVIASPTHKNSPQDDPEAEAIEAMMRISSSSRATTSISNKK